MSPDAFDDYYREENLTAPTAVVRSLTETIRRFEPYRRSGRLLDVGFGAGIALLAATEAGWSAEGVELSQRAIENARALSLRVHHGALEDLRLEQESFDVVVATELIEHVPDPRRTLAEIRRLVRPGGLLWLTTPHGDGLSCRVLGTRWSALVPPDHLHLFSTAGLRILLRATGFRPIRLTTVGLNPFELLRGLRRSGAPWTPDERVASSYALLEAARQRWTLRVAKASVNAVLEGLRLGDSIRVWATTS